MAVASITNINRLYRFMTLPQSGGPRKGAYSLEDGLMGSLPGLFKIVECYYTKYVGV